LRFLTIGKLPEQITDRRQHAFLLDADGGIAKTRSKFEREDTVVVDDAVEIDVPDIAFFSKIRFHFEKSLGRQVIGLAPEHGGTHFAGGGTDIPGKKFFMLEIDVDRRDEIFAIEESADGNFDSGNTALELKDFDLVGEGLFVGFQHADNVVAVFFFADEQAALDVLRFAAGLDDIAVGIFFNKFSGRIEGIEILVGNDVDAGIFQLPLAEGAIVLETIGVGAAANNGLAGRAEGLGSSALAEGVVEDHNIGPLRVVLPVFRLRNEAIG